MTNQITTDDHRHKLTTAKTRPALVESAHFMLDNLANMGAYVSNARQDGCIIKFAEPKLGSMRISDVACDPTYCTRWNLTSGQFVQVTSKYKSHWYSSLEMDALVTHLQGYANTIARNAPPADVAQPDIDKNNDPKYWESMQARESGGES